VSERQDRKHNNLPKTEKHAHARKNGNAHNVGYIGKHHQRTNPLVSKWHLKDRLHGNVNGKAKTSTRLIVVFVSSRKNHKYKGIKHNGKN